jgi:glycerophosphoryl diester phosphodiesterase
LKRIGHKGADAIRPGNTLESFAEAVEQGVDLIELDVLPLRDGRVVIAHDYGDAGRREPLTLDECIEAFTRSPLDAVEFDCDVKLAGPESEVVDALRGRDLVGRAMVSTMELSSLAEFRRLEPDLRRGWTYPKVGRDWTRHRWAAPPMLAALAYMRRRLPRLATRTLPRLGVQTMWVYHSLISPRLIDAADRAGVGVIAWTVDDLSRMRTLEKMGVDGICSNDPRLFAEL